MRKSTSLSFPPLSLSLWGGRQRAVQFFGVVGVEDIFQLAPTHAVVSSYLVTK